VYKYRMLSEYIGACMQTLKQTLGVCLPPRTSTYIQARAHTHTHTQVLSACRECTQLFDLLFQAEDVRDHLNELGEEKGRASGLAGTGVKAGEDVENMEENLGACVSAYEALVKRYPSFAIKTEEAVGNGLRALRSKKKFRYEQMHKHFF